MYLQQVQGGELLVKDLHFTKYNGRRRKKTHTTKTKLKKRRCIIETPRSLGSKFIKNRTVIL